MSTAPPIRQLLALLVALTALFGPAQQPPEPAAEGGSWQLTQAEPDSDENDASREERREGALPLDVELEENENGASNWLAWLVGLPLLAVVILLVLLLTRRRLDHDDSDEENR